MVAIIGLLLYLILQQKGCFLQDNDNGGGNDYTGGDYNPPQQDLPPDAYDDTPLQEGLVNCNDIVLSGYGDFNPVCAEGNCQTLFTSGTCSHYWDWINSEHKCSCTETYFCGQYCFEYVWDSGCECPPNSYQEWTSRSFYMCIPDNHYCQNGQPLEYANYPQPQ